MILEFCSYTQGLIDVVSVCLTHWVNLMLNAVNLPPELKIVLFSDFIHKRYSDRYDHPNPMCYC